MKKAIVLSVLCLVLGHKKENFEIVKYDTQQ